MRSLGFLVVFGVGLMTLAGGWSSLLLWLLILGFSAEVLYAMRAMAPDLARERFRPPSAGADAMALRWVRLTAFAAIIIAPLDGGRLHWSPAIPDTVRFVGIVGCLSAFFLCFHSMAVNRFFSAVMRIQHDRGHHVVDAGPYGVIRHPGYLGMIVGVPLFAIGLGSWWGFALASAYSLLILRRVSVEDRFLRENLPGYADYTMRVRSRLIPGLW